MNNLQSFIVTIKDTQEIFHVTAKDIKAVKRVFCSNSLPHLLKENQIDIIADDKRIKKT